MSKKKKAAKDRKVTNPNGYNKSKPDPRQALFLKYYLDCSPANETFSNARQSALKAGYGKKYADTLTAAMPSWLSESLKSSNLVKKAEKNVAKFLDDDYIENDKIKADITKFTLQNLGKAWNKSSNDTAKARLINVEIDIRSLIAGKPSKVVDVTAS